MSVEIGQITDAIYAQNGCPMDADHWHLAPAERYKVIEARRKPHTRASYKIAKELGGLYGEASLEGVSAKIVAQLNPHLIDIAATQMREGEGSQGKAWIQSNSKAGKELIGGLQDVFDDRRNFAFFDNHPWFLDSLVLMRRLIEENDSDLIVAIAQQMETNMVASYKRGLPVLVAPHYDGYTNPSRSHGEKPRSWNIEAGLMLPLSGKRQEKIQGIRDDAWGIMCSGYGIAQTDSPTVLIGSVVMNSGTAPFSAATGVGLDFPWIHGGTSWISYNHLIKSSWKWDAARFLFRDQRRESLLPSYLLMQVSHEDGHAIENLLKHKNDSDLFGSRSQYFGEARQDTLVTKGQLKKIQEGEENPLNVAELIVSEYAPVFLDHPDWIENGGNDGVYDGYPLSAAVILKVAVDNGLIQIDKRAGRLRTDFGDSVLADCVRELDHYKEGLIGGNSKVLHEIHGLYPSREVLQITDLFGQYQKFGPRMLDLYK